MKKRKTTPGELIIANKELVFKIPKRKTAAELIIIMPNLFSK
jgi:hypothetical protein